MAMQRTVGSWRWRRNPLRRGTDLVEAWAVLLLGLLIAFGAPLAGVLAGTAMHASLVRQNHERHQVTAVLQRDAPSVTAVRSGDVTPDQVRAPVQWRGSDGQPHTARVVVAPGEKAGTATQVWVGPGDQVTDPPLDGPQSVLQSGIVGTGAAGGSCVVVLFAHRFIRFDLDRHRARQWQREWARVGPQWSRGHHA